jgi:acetyl esterase/lipase
MPGHRLHSIVRPGENATGYFLTRSLMYWFWDFTARPSAIATRAFRHSAASLLTPAFVVTCEFDPLRDEIIAYAELGRGGG